MSHGIRVSGLAVAVLLLACGGKDPVGGGDTLPPILITGHDMGPRFQHFTISRGARSVAEAKVSVNGTALPATADGQYDYTIPAAIPVGEQLTVRVELDGDVVTATATIQPVPVVTTPAQDQHVVPGDELPFAWTTTESPAWWEVSIDWVFQGTGAVVQDSLPGGARTVTLATTTVPVSLTDGQGSVRAYTRGSFTGPADPASNMRVRFGSTPVNLVFGPAGPAPIKILGGDMGAQSGSFTISRDGADVGTATVTINGTTLPTTANGQYYYSLATGISTGQELVLRIVHDGDVVEGRAIIPPTPVLTTPIPNQVVTAGQPLAYSWTSPSDPDSWIFGLGFLSMGGTAGSEILGRPAPADRTGSLATALLAADATDLYAVMHAFVRGSFTGPADATSDMHLRVDGVQVPLIKAP